MGLFSSTKDKKDKKREELIKDANDFLNEIKKSGGLQPAKTSVLLKKNEKAFISADSVILKETRMFSKRGGAGMGVRLFKGVYMGGYQGESRSYPELRNIDEGILVITNKRLIFDGRTENRVIDLNKILSMQIYLDSIEVSLESKSKSSFFFVDNPYIWRTVFNIIRGVSDPENLKNVGLQIDLK